MHPNIQSGICFIAAFHDFLPFAEKAVHQLDEFRQGVGQVAGNNE